MQWILLGCVPIAGYWLIAYKMTYAQRQALLWALVTAIAIFAVAGLSYELLTTGGISAPPSQD